MSTTLNPTPKAPLLGNTSYDVVKDIVTLGFPAAVTLYSGLAIIWGWGFSEEVVATGGLLSVFLGVVLKISSKRWEKLPEDVDYNGALVVNMTDPEKDNYQLELDQPWNELGKLTEIRIKVVDES